MGHSHLAKERLTPTEVQEIKEINEHIAFLLKLKEEKGLEEAIKFIVNNPRF